MKQDNTARVAQAQTIEVITFEADGTQYAVPIEQVRYIQKDEAITTRIDTDSGSYYVVRFQGNPIPVVDFAEWTGGKASYVSNKALIETFNQREQDHVDWIDALEHSLRTGKPFTKARDPHQCAFGKWYDAFTTDDDMLADLLKDFDEPHRHIHSLAETLLALQESEGLEAAMVILERERRLTLSRLRELFADARDRLRSITRPVLVYLTKHDGNLIALRLSGLSDIESYRADQFSAYEPFATGGKDLPIIDGYLHARDSTAPPLVLLDFNKFV